MTDFRNSDISVYVHIPFCKARCGYCAFSSGTDFSSEDVYFDVLCREIFRAASACESRNVEASSAKIPVKTIFWGGGTPSSVSLKNLQKLYSALQSAFDLSALAEFSVECNPESTTQALTQFLKSIGANRLSFGLQSANDQTLAKIGRLHTYDGFLHALDIALKSGFSNINADLIVGLPESREDFFRTTELVCALPLEHLSLYALEIHPQNTAFKALCDAYGYTDDDLADMYDFAVCRFEQAGFERYEISNFAKRGKECLHNLNYWREGRYFGFGASASGFVQNVRYGNAFDVKKYIAQGSALFQDSNAEGGVDNCVDAEACRTAKNRCVVSDYCGVATEYCETISADEEMSEFVMLGLRLREGISANDFSRRFGADFFEKFPAAKSLVQRGFLLVDNGIVRVPENKLYVLNSVLTELLP